MVAYMLKLEHLNNSR